MNRLTACTVLVLLLLLGLVIIDPQPIPSGWLSAGRLHPVLLHLPIALVLLLLPLSILEQRSHDAAALRQLNTTILRWSAFLSSLTALAGLLLSSSGEYDATLLNTHKWWSIGLCICLLILVYLREYLDVRPQIWNLFLGLQIVALLIGSHQGGSLTHGSDFLSFTPQENKSVMPFSANDSISIWAGGVQPILNTKCVTCHNPNKKKGGLDLTQFASLKTGGKSGSSLDATDPLNSELLKRIALEMEDEKHMPPSGKPQLSPSELLILHAWVSRGASPSTLFKELTPTDSLRSTVAELSAGSTEKKDETVYVFDAANSSTISDLNNPFRRIIPLSANSPALSVRFFLKEHFTLSLLQECSPVAEQIVELNLSGMPCGDEVMDVIRQFPNLEKLNLNGTNVTGKTFSSIASNKHLQIISVSNTPVTAASLQQLKGTAVKKVFIWNTAVSSNELEVTKQQLPHIVFETGYTPDPSEVLKLTSPRPVNTERTIITANERIVLRHPLPGASIRYTLDGSKPDSLNGMLYKEPIEPSPITRIISVAFNKGWLSSDPSDYTYFQKGIAVDSVHLLIPPNERYRKNEKEVLTDLKKGFPEILNMNWLGYREQPLKAGFYLTSVPEITKVVVSTADNTGAYVFPPAKIIIRGGDSPQHLRTIGMLQPDQPAGYRSNAVIPYIVPIIKGNYAYIEVEAINVTSLPAWHGGKGQKAWVFVDEVFFY